MSGHNIHDAYFNSKYSSQLKFAITDYNCIYTSSYFQNIVVPFWMEYYLKDPRYMTIDNKPVIALGDTGRLKSYMGSTAAVKAATDYLRQQCVNAGFAGAIILTRYDDGVPNQAAMNDMAAMGIDYRYFYSFFSSNITDMQNRMIAYRDAGSTLKILPVAGLGELHLNAVVWGEQILPGEKKITDVNELLDSLGFDSITSYVWVHHNVMPIFPKTLYAKFREMSVKDFDKFTGEYKLPYFPNVTMGWDPSPRTIQSDVYDNLGYPFTPILDGNTPEEFEKALKQAREFLDGNLTAHKILTINAWNEWTEGSYLEPDMLNGMGYLEAIKRVFAK